MAFDAERAARRLTDAGMEPRAATGVADLVDDATGGLATKADIEALRADLYRALWLQGAGILAGAAAIATIARLLG